MMPTSASYSNPAGSGATLVLMSQDAGVLKPGQAKNGHPD